LNYTRKAAHFTCLVFNTQITIFPKWADYCDDCGFDSFIES